MGFQYSNPTSTTCAAAGSHGTSPGPIGTHPGPKKDGVFHHHLAPPASQAQRNQPLPPTRRLRQICAFSPWLLPLLHFVSSFVPSRLRGRRSTRAHGETNPLRPSVPPIPRRANRNPPTDGSKGRGVLLISHTSCVGLGFGFRFVRRVTCKSAGRVGRTDRLSRLPAAKVVGRQATSVRLQVRGRRAGQSGPATPRSRSSTSTRVPAPKQGRTGFAASHSRISQRGPPSSLNGASFGTLPADRTTIMHIARHG